MAQVAKRIRKQIRREGGGVDLAADLKAAVVVNSARKRGSRPSGNADSRDVETGKETR